MIIMTMMMITEAAGDEGGVEARRLEGFPGIDESEEPFNLPSIIVSSVQQVNSASMLENV